MIEIDFKVLNANLTDEYKGDVEFTLGMESQPIAPIGDRERYISISYHVVPEGSESIRLSTGDSLGDLDCFLIIKPMLGDQKQIEMGIGIMFCPIPGALWIVPQLPMEQYLDILSSVRAGQIPSSIRIGIRGITHQGYDMPFWDIETTPQLFVAHVSFSFKVLPAP